MRKRYGGQDYHQTRIITDTVSGEKLTIEYDPTLRDTQVDPDVEAELLGIDRQIPGDRFQRTITWVWPDRTTMLIKKLSVPVRATPQDLLFLICLAVKIPELNYRYTIITPEDWHYARAIRVEFAYERPSFDVLRKVPDKVFKSDFDFSMPAFIETDGACAGNNNKESPGGWGAIIVNGNRICKKFGSKNDTSNNEMEYQAMLEALSLIPQPPKPNLRPLVVIESDSQTCIDALSKFRFRWANRHWRREDGQPVEDAEQIAEIGQRLDHMRFGFWKIKGHS
jgi:ribonuclease HI